jgi:hypothetical protein
MNAASWLRAEGFPNDKSNLFLNRFFEKILRIDLMASICLLYSPLTMLAE